MICAALIFAWPLYAMSAERPRPVTIQDSIESTEVGQDLPGVAVFNGDPVAVFSPNHARFLVVVHRGDVARNTNDYSLLLFNSNQAFTHPKAHTLATFSVSTNNPGISALHWLSDNETVLFIGHRLNAHGEVYSINVRTGALHQITDQQTDVITFDATRDLRTMVFMAANPRPSNFGEAASRNGIVVSEQTLGDLVAGHPLGRSKDSSIYVWQRNRPTRKVKLPSGVDQLGEIPGSSISLSPNGQYAIVKTFMRDPKRATLWDYMDKASGKVVVISYILIDTQAASSRPLFSAPYLALDMPVWSSDSKSLIGGAYLPSNLLGSIEKPWQYETPADVIQHMETPSEIEIDVEQGAWRKIATGACVIDHWDPASSTLSLNSFANSFPPGIRSCGQPQAYRKLDGRWRQIENKAGGQVETIDVELVQDINSPPKLYAVEPKSNRRSLLLDLNPQYRALTFGHVQEVELQAEGETVRAGVYLPVDFKTGQRYPLVIQTHGWEPHRFAVDGVSTAGYAAQTLAGEGFVVAQVSGVSLTTAMTPREREFGMTVYQNLIDMLDKDALIERQRVGLQTWSRTGLTARYMAAFSKYPIVASVIVDSYDNGYFAYMAHVQAGKETGGDDAQTTEGINGGRPFGDRLKEWFTHVPDFNLQNVRTPILQFSFEPGTPLAAWEFFAGLKLLHKPIEYVYLPSSNHWPVRPSDRIAVQQRTVDWFRFWLQGYEDRSPGHEGQYRQWEQLCGEQIAEHSGWPTYCVPYEHKPR